MDTADEHPPEDTPDGESPFAEQPFFEQSPRIPPPCAGPIGPPPWYGLHPYPPPQGGPGMATWALVLSILGAMGTLTCCGYLGLPATITGLALAVAAKQKIKRVPETPGNGQATAALIISSIVLALMVLAVGAWLVFFGVSVWGVF